METLVRFRVDLDPQGALDDKAMTQVQQTCRGHSARVPRDGAGPWLRNVYFIPFFAVCVLLGFAGSDRCLGEPPPKTASADDDSFDAVAKDIEAWVVALAYPKSTADDLVQLVRDWKCELWKQKLTQVRFASIRGKPAKVAQAEQEVLEGLCAIIRREIRDCNQGEESEYFYLSKVVKDKKAQCLGYSQLVYILGSSIGLAVRVIDVPEPASGRLPAGTGHVACFVSLSDGKAMIVDLAQKHVSKPFIFKEEFGAVGNYWELKRRDNPLGLHRRIQVWNKSEVLAGIWANLAIAYEEAGDLDRAVSFNTKAIALNPKYAGALNNRGNAYGKSGQYAKAISDLTKAIELDPKYAEAFNNRGIQYDNSGQLAKAISDYIKAIELDPNFAEAFNDRGVAYGKSWQLAKAVADFTKAIELEPDHAETFNNRGNAYVKARQLTKAIADFTKAIELDPKYADAYFGRGVASALLGKADAAKRDFRKAAELNPALKEKIKRMCDQLKLR